jgi:hypothetical protein
MAALFGLQSDHASKAMTRPTEIRNTASEAPLTGVLIQRAYASMNLRE